MKKLTTQFLVLIFAVYLFPSSAFPQVIEADPQYPTQSDAVDITFHVNRCDCSLEEYTGDIYAHTGVLTDSSADAGDWKYVIAEWNENIEKAKLEKLDDTTYTLHITPSMKAYYDIPDGVNVTDLAFVFRKPDGSAQSSDLFYTVYKPGLAVEITKPAADVITQPDSIVPIKAEAVALGTAIPDSLSLYIDNSLEYTSYADTLAYNFSSSTPGAHWVKVVTQNDTYTAADSVMVFVRNEITVAALPAGLGNGANIINDTAVTLVLHAPGKESVLLIGDFNNWELNNNYLMNRTSDSSHFWLTLDDVAAGTEYAYQYLVDGNLRIADPYTEKILDPVNDSYISSETYPNLKTYPAGKTTGLVSVFQTAQEAYTWQVTDFTPVDKTDLVIYEIHVQNYSDIGNIKFITDTLDYLERLGVNAIELMPVNEFEGNLSWGYNPSFYFAFDKTYGTKNDLKAFVDACHAKGIAVIIDMVLNHSYSQSPFLQLYFDKNTNKPTPDNPWYNVNHNFVDNTATHWGYDFNHESEATQNLVDSINSFWMSEYQIDGFRFDFTKGFSNTQWTGANNWASDYDADRIAILERMTSEIWERNPDALVIFEHLATNTEETELSDYGIMLWGNLNHQYAEATMGYSSNFSQAAYTSRSWSDPHLISYMESHDEERIMYKAQRWGNSNAQHDVTNLQTALLRMEASAAFFFLIPGPKMLFEWGELGYDYSINRCANGTVDDDGGCRLDLKPVAWNYYENPNRYRLYKVFEALIKLRTEEDLFETTDFTLVTGNAMKKMHLNGAAMNATILGNFGITGNTIIPGFQHTGTWYDYLTGESIEVVNTDDEISLAPGEYKIYLDEQLDTPEIPVALQENNAQPKAAFNVFPNPSSGRISIAAPEGIYYRFELYNLSGQKVLAMNGTGESTMEVDVNQNRLLEEGIYLYKIVTAEYTLENKLILTK